MKGRSWVDENDPLKQLRRCNRHLDRQTTARTHHTDKPTGGGLFQFCVDQPNTFSEYIPASQIIAWDRQTAHIKGDF